MFELCWPRERDGWVGGGGGEGGDVRAVRPTCGHDKLRATCFLQLHGLRGHVKAQLCESRGGFSVLPYLAYACQAGWTQNLQAAVLPFMQL